MAELGRRSPRTDIDKDETAENKRRVATRWGGHPLVMQHGFTPVATAFLWYAAHLEPDGLSSAETLFVLHLMTHKWGASEPHPSYQRIAQRMGVSQIYVRKLAQALERRGFLRRKRRTGDSNLFDLQPLFDKLTSHMIAQRVAASSDTLSATVAEAEVDFS